MLVIGVQGNEISSDRANAQPAACLVQHSSAGVKIHYTTTPFEKRKSILPICLYLREFVKCKCKLDVENLYLQYTPVFHSYYMAVRSGAVVKVTGEQSCNASPHTADGSLSAVSAHHVLMTGTVYGRVLFVCTRLSRFTSVQ